MIPSRLFNRAILLMLAILVAAMWAPELVGKLSSSLFSTSSLEAHKFGNGDFIEYWSSNYLMEQGKNPYDPKAQLEVQHSLGRTTLTPLMMWNPPWAVLLLKPFLSWSFLTSAQIFLWINLIMSGVAIGCAILAAQGELLSSSSKYVASGASLIALLFLPWWNALQLGQLAFVLSAAAWAFYFLLVRRHYCGAGFLLSILSLKPHLFLVLGIAVLIWSIQQRKFQLIVSTLAGVLLLALGSWFLAPSSIDQWLFVSLNQSQLQGVENVYQWRVATLSDVIRNQFAEGSRVHAGAGFLVPWISCLGVAIWMIRKRPTIDWQRDFPWMLALSVICAPVGWVSDQVLLAPLLVILTISIWSHPSVPHLFLGSGILGFLSFCFWYRTCCVQFHHQLWWIPLGVLASWLFWQFGQPFQRARTEST